MEWNGVRYNQIPLFGFVKKEWNGMKWNGVWWNSFHPILPILPIFDSSQFGVYPMEWNTLITQLQFYPYLFYFTFLRLRNLIFSLFPVPLLRFSLLMSIFGNLSSVLWFSLLQFYSFFNCLVCNSGCPPLALLQPLTIHN